MLSKLYAHIAQNFPLNEDFKHTIEQYFTPLQVPKNTIIEEEGKVVCRIGKFEFLHI